MSPYQRTDEGEAGLRPALDELIAKAVSEVLANILNEQPPRLTLPIRWADSDSGQPVKDATTIYLLLPFGKGQDEAQVYELSLAEIIEEAFWPAAEREDPDAEHYELTQPARALAARLRKLANLIERSPDDWGKTRHAKGRE